MIINIKRRSVLIVYVIRSSEPATKYNNTKTGDGVREEKN